MAGKGNSWGGVHVTTTSSLSSLISRSAMQSVLTTAEESIQSGTELDNYEVETAVGADGGPPSIWFPEQIRTYTTTLSSHVTSFQEAVNDNLGPTSIGAGCKLLSTLLLG